MGLYLFLISGSGELGLSVADLLDNAGLALLVRKLDLSQVLVALGSLDSVSDSLVLDIASGLLLEDGVRTDGKVRSLVHLVNLVGGQASLDELGELLLISLGVLLLQGFHVSGDVSSQDSVLMGLGVVLAVLALSGVSGESLDAMGDINASIARTLQGTEDSGTNGGSEETNIQDGLEGASLALEVISNVELVTSGLLLSNKGGVQTDLLQQTTSQEQAGGVSSRVILQTNGDSELGELSGQSLAQNSISLDGRVDDLADDLRVCSSHNETVLVGVVFVLILLDKSSALSVVGLALSSSSGLGLESLVVSVSLHSLDKCHCCLAGEILSILFDFGPHIFINLSVISAIIFEYLKHPIVVQ